MDDADCTTATVQHRGMPRQENNSPGLHFVIVDHIFIVVIEYGQSIMDIITEGGEGGEEDEEGEGGEGGVKCKMIKVIT